MTFPFTATIPAQNNDPADDQPLMLQNNSSTSGLIAIDHVGFNINQGGQHKQITFAANQSAPSLPSGSVSELYVNSNAGALGTFSSLFFNDGTNNLGLTNVTLVTTTPSATGYGFVTPWGLKLNWGQISAVPITGKVVTFQVPFTTVHSIVCTSNNTNANDGNVNAIPGNTTFTCYSANTNNVFFFAIGV